MAGRYVKIAFTTNWGDSLNCMDTLHVCDADGVKWNNENMTHTTGGGLVNGDPKNCSDATADNYWQTSTRPNWWKVDLGQTRQISKVKTKVLDGFATRNIKAFTVSVSDDDTNWTEILSTTTANNDSVQTFDTTDGPPGKGPANFLSFLRRDRIRTKGVSLGLRVIGDGNTSYLIARHNRLRVTGISLEAASAAMPPYSSVYPPAHSTTYVKTTSEYGEGSRPWFTTDPALSLIGAWDWNAWLSNSSNYTNQRFHIDLGEAIVIKRIYYENLHNSGTSTDGGVQNFTFWGGNTGSGSFDDLVYANDDGWTQLTTSQSTFDQHTASNVADPKYIDVTNTTAYRYYAFKFADTWGWTYMGVRRIELQRSNY